MPIHAVMNDKKTSRCRGTARVKFNFLYHLPSRRAFWDTEDYGSGPHSRWVASPPAAVLGEGGLQGRLRETQTISAAYRQKHCTGLSSRGCLTSSSCFKVLLGLIVCQMTCSVLQAAGFKNNSHSGLFPLLYSVYSGRSLIRRCDFLSLDLELYICFLHFPELFSASTGTVTKTHLH